MNLTDATTVLWLVKSHWSNFQVLDDEKQAIQAGAWLDVLGDLDLAAVRAALAQYDADGHEFPPTAGQLREVVLASTGNTAPTWDQALAAVLNSIQRYGTNPEYRLSSGGPNTRPKEHPVIEETVRALGGWAAVGHSQMSDAFRAQFRDLYRLAAERHDREAKRPPGARALTQLVTGLAEARALPSPAEGTP